MEKLHIPAAVICTEPFIEQSRTMANAHSYPNYPVIEAFHPLATATLPSIEKEAQRIFQQVLDLLLVSIKTN